MAGVILLWTKACLAKKVKILAVSERGKSNTIQILYKKITYFAASLRTFQNSAGFVFFFRMSSRQRLADIGEEEKNISMKVHNICMIII